MVTVGGKTYSNEGEEKNLIFFSNRSWPGIDAVGEFEVRRPIHLFQWEGSEGAVIEGDPMRTT